MKKLIFTILGMLIFCGLFAQEIPQKISYQGKLLENGVPVTGTKSITFTIDTWTETHPSVQVTDGLYSVTLGETTPIPTSIFDNTSTLNLQVSVEGSDLTPQTEILSVPYAYKAETAASAEPIGTAGGDLSGTYPNPIVSSLQSRTVSSTAPTTNQVLKWDGTQWTPQADNGLTLPYFGTYSGSSDAFRIEDTVTGGRARFFGETDNILQLAPSGSSTWGASGLLDIQNQGGSNTGLNIDNNSSGNGIYLTNSNGSGDAIYIDNYSDNSAIDIDNHGNNFPAIQVHQSGAADGLYVRTIGSGNAAYFDGNVEITGSISKGSGTFKIDDPLDPENKYLYHSFVESPDMMNIYNGNITTDANGVAVVQLPEYFEALNKDFRYQLTVIGVFCQAIVYQKVNNNQFTIKTEMPNVEVSWQVTGIRHDPYANAHRVQPVVEKSAKEKGHYLHYKEYNQPIEKSISVVKNPKLLKKHKITEDGK